MSVGVDSATEPLKVFVQLLGEGTVVFRPTLGVPLGNGMYRLLPTDDYDPEDESWEFLPGSIVRCEERRINGDQVLVAVSLG